MGYEKGEHGRGYGPWTFVQGGSIPCGNADGVLVVTHNGVVMSIFGPPCSDRRCRKCGIRKVNRMAREYFEAWLRPFPMGEYGALEITLIAPGKTRKMNWSGYVQHNRIPPEALVEMQQCLLRLREISADRKVYYAAYISAYRAYGAKGAALFLNRFCMSGEARKIISVAWTKVKSDYHVQTGHKLSYVAGFARMENGEFVIEVVVPVKKDSWKIVQGRLEKIIGSRWGAVTYGGYCKAAVRVPFRSVDKAIAKAVDCIWTDAVEMPDLGVQTDVYRRVECSRDIVKPYIGTKLAFERDGEQISRVTRKRLKSELSRAKRENRMDRVLEIGKSQLFWETFEEAGKNVVQTEFVSYKKMNEDGWRPRLSDRLPVKMRRYLEYPDEPGKLVKAYG